MKKSLSLVLALVFVLGIAGTAFAANPFVDVPAKHWAYNAVSQLAKAGIVDGYEDGTFRGDKTMTRYEMAQIVAKAMVKADKADAANKALIEKLSAEFSAELDNLGVRVSKLEKNQPNLKFFGGFDVRATAKNPDVGASSSDSQYRLRLDGAGVIDADTTYGMRIVTRAPQTNYSETKYSNVLGDDEKAIAFKSGAKFKNDTWQSFGGDKVEANIDRVFVTRKMGAFTTTFGRQALVIDPLSCVIDSGAFSFDGVKTAWKSGEFNFNAQYGRFTKGVIVDGDSSAYPTTNATTGTTTLNAGVLGNLDTYGLTAASKAGKLAYTLGYDVFKGGETATGSRDIVAKYWLVNADYTFDNKFSFVGQFLKNDEADNDNNVWLVKGIYGAKSIAKAGDQNLTVQYYSVGANSIVPAFTTLDTVGNTNFHNYKVLDYGYNYGFSKTFAAELRYVIASDKDDSANDYKYLRLVLHSKF